MRFVDANIFIKWMSALKRKLSLEAAISGFILHRIRNGEQAITTTLVKDEVLIWLSRYRASKIRYFLSALRLLLSLEIVPPTMEDEEKAASYFGKWSLGISDLINVAVMERMGINEIYTNDSGYEEAGVKVIFYELMDEDEFNTFVNLLIRMGYRLGFKI